MEIQCSALSFLEAIKHPDGIKVTMCFDAFFKTDLKKGILCLFLYSYGAFVILVVCKY